VPTLLSHFLDIGFKEMRKLTWVLVQVLSRPISETVICRIRFYSVQVTPACSVVTLCVILHCYSSSVSASYIITAVFMEFFSDLSKDNVDLTARYHLLNFYFSMTN
jgi:uncharacterized membrane protein YfbV (UPF0208 family)